MDKKYTNCTYCTRDLGAIGDCEGADVDEIPQYGIQEDLNADTGIENNMMPQGDSGESSKHSFENLKTKKK